jgi:hypothetical protein
MNPMMTVDGGPGANGWSNESEGVVEWCFLRFG